MREAEIILKYPVSAKMEDYQEAVLVTCITELSNYAYELQHQTSAEIVNFNFIGEENVAIQ